MTVASPELMVFDSRGREFGFVPDGSRVFELDSETAGALRRSIHDGRPVPVEYRRDLGLDRPPQISDRPPEAMPVRSLSLAVAQKCNLGCTYCYAREGDFGGPARNMSLSVAKQSVERLLAESNPGEKVNLAFLGGEPLVNRAVLREATVFARQRAVEAGVELGLSVTTNGTLLTAKDAEFFERHGFAVTVSVDGIGETHDRMRPTKGGGGSFEKMLERVTPLLEAQRRMQVSARVTVTPRNLELPVTLVELIRLGFHSVGFSPMLSSPTGRDEMDADDLGTLLEQMKACGSEFERAVVVDRRFPFSNMTSAMQEIHRGTHRPYPCGAGGGYFGVSAEGGLFACHRFVDDEAGAMGDIFSGVDAESQGRWLGQRHVHFQDPCRGCWARYLCGGGCHHEVIHRGWPACDYIRGWLEYCLGAYVRLLDARPDYFGIDP